MINTSLSRRTLFLGSAAAGVAAWTGLPAGSAFAAPLVYDSPEAFDTAQAAYLATNPTNNEDGKYAWGESYFLLSLLRMYEAYQDERYLRTFEDRAAHVLATTDHARGVEDYSGRSGPVWRAAGNYTVGRGVLHDGDGTPAVEIRWAWSRPAESTAEVSNVSGETFDLVLRNPFVTGVVTLRGVSLDPASPSYVVTAVNKAFTSSLRWTAADLRQSPHSAPAPAATTVTFTSDFYVFAVHTGMVAYPLARYARMVFEDPKLRRGPRRLRTAVKLLAAATAAVQFHDGEYVANADGTGNYVWPKGAPVPWDGTIQPYNQSHGLGLVQIELYRATKSRRHLTRVKELLKAYRTGLKLTADGAYLWTYWPPYSQVYAGFTAAAGISEYTPSFPAQRQYEDISHAAISTEFMHAAYDAGIDADLATEVQRFAATFTHHIIRSANEVWFVINGTSVPVPDNAVQCARWCNYAEQDLLIYQQSLRVYDAQQLNPVQGSHALGIAYLNWAKQSGWTNK
ncbi:hypothetical protein AB0L70_28030 [Kribbella sp. NPDC051952]|uniref:hypothetical protein n=1 Tax=Kribbella sp. NPDC051952 TaxID=3154851 RepID=UPI00342C7F7F